MSSTHTPAPFALRDLKALCRLAPAWGLGQDDPLTQAGLLPGLGRLAQEDGRFAPVARGLARWSCQWRPWSAELARLALDSQRDALSPAQRSLLAAVADLPAVADDWAVMFADPDPRQLIGFFLPRLRGPQGPAWLLAAWEMLLKTGQAELAASLLEAVVWPEVLAPLAARLTAEWRFHYAPAAEALAAVQALDRGLWGLWSLSLAATLQEQLGDRAACRHSLSRLWRQLPWHTGTILRYHDALHPLPSHDGALERSRVAVCVYSWNKAQLLDATLASLAATRLGGARMLCLDNGSSDATDQVVAAWADRLGERFTPIRLPVNIGAPAARNWCLAHPMAQAVDWVAFLDDDVVLPPHWLGHLLSAAGQHPSPGAVGCRITASQPPYGLQSADYNLFAPPPSPQPWEDRLLVYDNVGGALDVGLFAYSRTCLSVSGCCHLLSRRALDAAGPFDIRFNPTQFDDLERDLRSWLAGFPAIFAGGLAVRHVQHSSLAKAQTPAAVGNVMGNRMKLEGKYDTAQIARLASENQTLLVADLLAKAASLFGQG